MELVLKVLKSITYITIITSVIILDIKISNAIKKSMKNDDLQADSLIAQAKYYKSMKKKISKSKK